MFGEDLVVWIEPCVAHDADMRLKWAESLAKYGAITGDELRDLSPFDLTAGEFSAPVVGGRDQQLDDAIAALTMEPERAVRNVVERSPLIDVGLTD